MKATDPNAIRASSGAGRLRLCEPAGRGVRGRERHTGRWVAALVLACVAAGPLSASSTVDDVLTAMRDRGSLHGFTADVMQTQEDTTLDTVYIYRGQLWYQGLSNGDARLHLVLNTKQKADGKPVASKKEYLVANGTLTDRDYTINVEKQTPLAKAGEKLNLFKPDSPLPLPIGQDPAAVTGSYDVTRVPPDKDDPPHTIHLTLKPKPTSRYAAEFKHVDFWVDAVQQMPVRVQTTDTREAKIVTYDLTDVRLNPDLAAADFTLPPTAGKWR